MDRKQIEQVKRAVSSAIYALWDASIVPEGHPVGNKVESAHSRLIEARTMLKKLEEANNE